MINSFIHIKTFDVVGNQIVSLVLLMTFYSHLFLGLIPYPALSFSVVRLSNLLKRNTMSSTHFSSQTLLLSRLVFVSKSCVSSPRG